MKIAIVHDYLCGFGGSERVFQYMCEEFSEADIYTLAYNPESTYSYFKGQRIRTTWLNPFVRSMDAFRWAFPLATYTMEWLNLDNYDVVLSSSATVAKYVRVPNGRHICYCYFPTRAIWQSAEYFGSSWKSNLIKPLLPYLRKRDYEAAQRVDKFISISQMTQTYVRQYYGRDSDIIYSPINLKNFHFSEDKKDHYLIVSRLEQWKRLDYAIEAFNHLGKPLKVIGTGNEESRLKAMAHSNICFLGVVDDDALAHEYSMARAVIFTPFLEYGLIPLEANASGTPVICYGKGGITETMVPFKNTSNEGDAPTAIFYYEQTAAALMEAVEQFEKVNFDANKLILHAAKWDVPVFKQKMRQALEEVSL